MEHVGRDSRAAAQASTARSGARTARRLRGCPRARSARLESSKEILHAWPRDEARRGVGTRVQRRTLARIFKVACHAFPHKRRS